MIRYRLYHCFTQEWGVRGTGVPTYTVGEYKSYEEAIRSFERTKATALGNYVGSYLVRIKEHIYA